MAESLSHVRGLGFEPRTVIDVGAADGTFDLYDTFPDASLVLIEPLREYEPSLQRICRRYNAQYILAAASNGAGTALIHVHPDLSGSSLLREIEGEHANGVSREVPAIAIDEISRRRNLQGPFVVKVDVQGAELMVLEGAGQTLSETELVILEISLFGTLIGGPQLHEAVAYMKERGFVVHDIFGGLFRPRDGALAQVDMSFVKENGLFRKSHAYATPNQRLKLIEDALRHRRLR